MNVFSAFKFLTSTTNFIKPYLGKQVAIEQNGLQSFLFDWSNFGFRVANTNFTEMVEDYSDFQISFKILWGYLKGLLNHKWVVFKLGELFEVPLYLRIFHDTSKFRPNAFIAYAVYFHGNRNHQVKQDFHKQWHKHIHENKHHWQYWVSLNDDGTKQPMQMPEKYVKEMITDWVAANFMFGNRNIWNWYSKRKFVFTTSTQVKVDLYMEYILNNLDLLMGIVDASLAKK